MRKHTVLLSCAAGALIAALCLSGADRQGHIMFIDALKALGAGATPSEFERHYLALDARDPALSLNLAILYPWLATGAAWGRIYAPTAARTATGAGGIAPPRSGAPVDRLTITGFSVGTTSLFIRAEWPPATTPIPWGWLELMGKVDLADGEEWDYLTFVDVEQAQGFVESEIRFSQLSWDYWDDVDFSVKAFFKLQAPEVPEGWWWWEEEEEEDNSSPPAVPLLGAMTTDLIFLDSGPFSTPSSSTKTVPLTPGEHYLIVADCFDHEVELIREGKFPKNSYFTWNISIPGVATLTESVDTYMNSVAIPRDPFTTKRHFRPNFWVVYVPLSSVNPSATVSMSIMSDPFPQFYAGGIVFMSTLIAPFRIHQRNMPLAAQQPNPGSTDTGSRSPRYIAENGIAFITGEPAPPSLEAQIGGYSHLVGFNIGWRMTLETERPDRRGTLDDKVYPLGGGYASHPFSPYSPLYDVTGLLMRDELVGGKCVLYCKLASTYITPKELEMQFPFSIKGMNPTDASARAFINQWVPSFSRSYAWAIFRHESMDGPYIYCQFNALENHLKWLPNWGGPDGWGIVQIDRSEHTPKDTAKTAEVYNWHANVLAGAQTLTTKQSEFNSFLREIEANYPLHWTSPPATTSKYGVTWTREQWGVTVLYNSGKGVRPTVVWRNGRRIEISCPLRFNPNSPTKWTFEDNGRKYAQEIAPYLPPNIPPVAPE